MTTLYSSSAAESSMDDGESNGYHHNQHLQTLTKHRSPSTTTASNRNGSGKGKKQSSKDDGEEEGDPEVWDTLSKSFREVQSMLDRNRVLIQQVNENHQSKIPDNLVKNVALIQEINGNISKVVSLYSDLSSDFSGVFHQRNEERTGVAKNGGIFLSLQIKAKISNAFGKCQLLSQKSFFLGCFRSRDLIRMV